MHAVMLAAGVARRLYGDGVDGTPKALLAFAGRTLLARHLRILRWLGVSGLTLVVGHRADEVVAEAVRWAPTDFVHPVVNPDYRLGSIVSLDAARVFLTAGDDVLLMDADVLYPAAMLHRLLAAPGRNRLLYDRAFEPGEEPVKLCLADGAPVDFGKQVDRPHDEVGEWPGLMTMAPEVAREVAAVARDHVERGAVDAPCEDAIRQVLHCSTAATFAGVDITGMPWIEIDFAEDLARARAETLPAVEAYEAGEPAIDVPD